MRLSFASQSSLVFERCSGAISERWYSQLWSALLVCQTEADPAKKSASQARRAEGQAILGSTAFDWKNERFSVPRTSVLRSPGVRLEEAVLRSTGIRLEEAVLRSSSIRLEEAFSAPQAYDWKRRLTLMKSEQPGAESRDKRMAWMTPATLTLDRTIRRITKAWATSPSSSLASTSGQLSTHVSEVFVWTPVIVSAVVQQDPLAVLPDGAKSGWRTSCISCAAMYSTLPRTLGDSNRRSVAATAPGFGRAAKPRRQARGISRDSRATSAMASQRSGASDSSGATMRPCGDSRIPLDGGEQQQAAATLSCAGFGDEAAPGSSGTRLSARSVP
uniref:Uncharacterized protein n=1 Tax=Macrostomum lignano TaxID=282301 RepID=A0A1I8F4L2_9PLAT